MAKQYLTQYSHCCEITVISQKLIIFSCKSKPPGSDYLVLAYVAVLIPVGAHLAEWWEPKITIFYPSTLAILGFSKRPQELAHPLALSVLLRWRCQMGTWGNFYNLISQQRHFVFSAAPLTSTTCWFASQRPSCPMARVKDSFIGALVRFW